MGVVDAASPCRIAAGRLRAHVVTPGPKAKTPVNATRANGGTRGGRLRLLQEEKQPRSFG